MRHPHQIEIFKDEGGRYFTDIVCEKDCSKFWRSPRYRWYWVARLLARPDARDYIRLIDEARGNSSGTFVKRLKL